MIISKLTVKTTRPHPLQFEATDGFSLVELLVVLAIIGLIAAFATPNVLKYLGSSRVSASKAQMKNISSALELYFIDVGNYPDTNFGLDALINAPSGTQNWNGPYIKGSTALKDAWGNNYSYTAPAGGSSFSIKSFGQDGKAGGIELNTDLLLN